VVEAVQATVAGNPVVDDPRQQRRHHRPQHKVWDYPPEQWMQVMQVNLNGLFFCCREIVPADARAELRPHRQHRLGGRQGRQPERQCLQRQQGRRDRADQVAGQGAGRHRRARELRDAGGGEDAIFDQMSPEHIQFMLSKIPMGRFGTPEEVAAMVSWLCTKIARSPPARCSTSLAAAPRIDGDVLIADKFSNLKGT
jgi:NAD(P)-dependent dehydrogenase (short-subunit alcohol dehydrogenase family)